MQSKLKMINEPICKGRILIRKDLAVPRMLTDTLKAPRKKSTSPLVFCSMVGVIDLTPPTQ